MGYTYTKGASESCHLPRQRLRFSILLCGFPQSTLNQSASLWKTQPIILYICATTVNTKTTKPYFFNGIKSLLWILVIKRQKKYYARPPKPSWSLWSLWGGLLSPPAMHQAQSPQKPGETGFPCVTWLAAALPPSPTQSSRPAQCWQVGKIQAAHTMHLALAHSLLVMYTLQATVFPTVAELGSLRL